MDLISDLENLRFLLELSQLEKDLLYSGTNHLFEIGGEHRVEFEQLKLLKSDLLVSLVLRETHVGFKFLLDLVQIFHQVIHVELILHRDTLEDEAYQVYENLVIHELLHEQQHLVLELKLNQSFACLSIVLDQIFQDF